MSAPSSGKFTETPCQASHTVSPIRQTARQTVHQTIHQAAHRTFHQTFHQTSHQPTHPEYSQYSVKHGVRVLPALSSRSSVSLADRLGMALSGLCLVHCLMLPLVLPMLAVASDAAEHPIVHLVLALLIFPTTLWSAWHGYKHHGRRSIPTLLMCGALTITLAALFGEHIEGLTVFLSHEMFETVLTSLGSVMLVTGHWKNWQHSEACDNNCIHRRRS